MLDIRRTEADLRFMLRVHQQNRHLTPSCKTCA